MNNKFWLGFIVLVIGVLGFAVYSSKQGSVDSRKVDDPRVVQADDRIRGSIDSDVALVVYGDFECPVCNSWEPTLQSIEAEYGDRVAFVFRHFPLVNIHVNAFASARAAEAAEKQGKFWEMHDLLYEKWNDWRGDVKSAQGKFEGYAEELGLDLDKFKEDYESQEVADRINSDKVSGSAYGGDNDVEGTPTFYLNGQKLDVGGPAEGEAKIKLELDRILAEVNSEQ